jgi:broad specificity phosphatase PhoE
MERILQSFHSIVKLSSSKFNDTHSKPQEDQYQYQRDVVAISHRKFIRMMLAIALDIPLFQAFTTLQQRNGCMNILDISTTETITWVASQSKLFLGSRRQLQLNNGHDFQMILPKINVIKVDDNRHLDGYISQQQK